MNCLETVCGNMRGDENMVEVEGKKKTVLPAVKHGGECKFRVLVRGVSPAVFTRKHIQTAVKYRQILIHHAGPTRRALIIGNNFVLQQDNDLT